MTVRTLLGDCRTILPTLPAESVHCVVTSPPYYGLRDYGVAGQIGLEPTPGEYIAELVAVFREVRRVLRKDGTVFLNLGDSYAASQTNNGGYSAKSTLAGFTNPTTKGRQANESGGHRQLRSGAKPKDLLMIPARVALALQADGWWLRSDIIWAKPNPMPESVTDRPTSSHEHVFLLAKAATYFFDADAVREAYAPASAARYDYEFRADVPSASASKSPAIGAGNIEQNPLGRNIRNVWTIATSPYPEAHFATFPPELAERCIKAGTSERGCCSACGAPWVRQVEKTGYHFPEKDADDVQIAAGVRIGKHKSGPDYARFKADNPDVFKGWFASCDCRVPFPYVHPCTVLDPFGGAGTVGLVADRLQRNAVLIELNPAYIGLATARVHDDAPLLAGL